jgi:hypothetical protein
MHNSSMPRVTTLFGRRLGPIGVALTAWDLWRRIPRHHRKRIIRAARKHGPRVARHVAQRRGFKIR